MDCARKYIDTLCVIVLCTDLCAFVFRASWFYREIILSSSLFNQIVSGDGKQPIDSPCSLCSESHYSCYNSKKLLYRVFNVKVDRILIWVIYLLRFTRCYITQLTCVYSMCWKWCRLISLHLSTRFTMFLTTFLSVLYFFNHFCNNTFYWRLPSKFFKGTLSTVGVRHRF